VKVFGWTGELLASSDETIITPGTSQSFDFNRDALASPGERDTNRLQVRVKPEFAFTSHRLSRVLASVEIIDNMTGKTEVLMGHECLVFFLGGMPGKPTPRE
jgi:hypothetical protein